MADEPPLVAVTRPRPKVARTERLLMARGLEPLSAPTLEIQAHDDPALEMTLEDVDLGNVDRVVFTGATGVRFAAGQVREGGWDGLADLLEGNPTVAIGPRTREALEEAGVEVEAVPETHSSAGLVEWFADRNPTGDQVALLRSTRGTPVLPKGLRDLGVEVREAQVYDLAKPEPGEAHERLFEALEARQVDGYTFTSSLTAEHFLEFADEVGPGRAAAREALAEAVVGAIGDPTRSTLEDRGVLVDVVPDEARVEALADAVARLLDAG